MTYILLEVASRDDALSKLSSLPTRTRIGDPSLTPIATLSPAVPRSTHFDVPATQELGLSQLVVVANGIPSAPVAVTVQRRSQIVWEETAAISIRHRRRIERNFTPETFRQWVAEIL